MRLRLVASLLAGDRLILSKFQKVHPPHLWPITDQFPSHHIRRLVQGVQTSDVGSSWKGYI